MDLRYLTRLTEEDWVDLINSFIKVRLDNDFTNKNKKKVTHVATNFEYNRRDEKGNQIAYAEAWDLSNGSRFVQAFYLTDFEAYNAWLDDNFNNKLREFLTSKFEDYDDAYQKTLEEIQCISKLRRKK